MKYLVIKCGGSVMEQLPHTFYENIVELYKNGEFRPVIVHGGGPLISSLLKKLGVESQFINGLRVTTNQVLDVVEMVLSGAVNKELVRKLQIANGDAYGISGVDGMLLRATPTTDSEMLGFVGEVVEVKTDLIKNILDQGYIPVISPVGVSENGQRYNINGDIAASAIAKAIGGNLCIVSDIPGIYTEDKGEKVILPKVTKDVVESLIETGIITGGMIPKVKAAIDGLVHKVPEVVILNGMEMDSLKRYAEGKKIGTKIVLNRECQDVY